MVTSTFDELVLNNDNDVFIKFFAPWCGHCKDLAPVWLELAETLEVVPNLTIAEIDATENEVPGFDITGYPSIYLLVAGKKESPIEYQGPRTLENMVAYLSENSPALAAYLAMEPEDDD